MARQLVFITLTVLLISVRNVEPSQETMKDLTIGFFKTLEECKKELNLEENVVADLYHFWKEDYSLLNRNVGCTIVCMSKKLNVVSEDGKLHHENAQEFAKQHGASDELASKLVNIVHECEKKFESLEDECTRALEVAKCFRTSIHDLDWAPKMDVIISELMTEM